MRQARDPVCPHWSRSSDVILPIPEPFSPEPDFNAPVSVDELAHTAKLFALVSTSWYPPLAVNDPPGLTVQVVAASAGVALRPAASAAGIKVNAAAYTSLRTCRSSLVPGDASAGSRPGPGVSELAATALALMGHRRPEPGGLAIEPAWFRSCRPRSTCQRAVCSSLSSSRRRQAANTAAGPTSVLPRSAHSKSNSQPDSRQVVTGRRCLSQPSDPSSRNKRRRVGSAVRLSVCPGPA